MSGAIEQLLAKYEGGRISRRDLVVSLTALMISPSRTSAQPRTPPVAVRTLNHVSISVSGVSGPVAGSEGGGPALTGVTPGDGIYIPLGNVALSTRLAHTESCGASTVRPENAIGVGCDAMYAQTEPGTSTGSPLDGSMP